MQEHNLCMQRAAPSLCDAPKEKKDNPPQRAVPGGMRRNCPGGAHQNLYFRMGLLRLWPQSRCLFPWLCQKSRGCETLGTIPHTKAMP